MTTVPAAAYRETTPEAAIRAVMDLEPRPGFFIGAKRSPRARKFDSLYELADRQLWDGEFHTLPTYWLLWSDGTHRVGLFGQHWVADRIRDVEASGGYLYARRPPRPRRIKRTALGICRVCGGEGEHDFEVHNAELRASEMEY